MVNALLVLSLLFLAQSAFAQVTVTPLALAFGNHYVGMTSAPKSVTLTNTQTVPLTISSIAISGGTAPADYAWSTNCRMTPNTLRAGGDCVINVTFAPSAPGSRSATLTVTYNASNSPQSVSLTGIGVVPVTLVPAGLTFGNHYVGMTSAFKSVTLTNPQTVPLTINNVAISGTAPADYASSTNCNLAPGTLRAGGKCIINITFAPSALGTRTATLTVSYNASNSPQSIALTGTGLAPVTLSPTTLTFASQPMGTKSASQTVTLTNHLSSSVSVSSVSANGDFAITSNTCGSSVGAGGQCRIGVTFSPTVPGLRTGTLSIYDSAFGSPNQVSLNGVGSSEGQTWGRIQHVVVIVQENRTPDNLFQDPVLIANGADIASSGLNSKGQTIPLSPIDLGTTGSSPQNYDLSHIHSAFVAMYDGGKMDGADLIPCTPAAQCPPNAHPNPQFMYVQPSDVAPYFQMAEQYTFGDRMFQTNQGPSFPAHQFILSGTSAPTATSSSFAAENSGGKTGDGTGCVAPPADLVWLIDPTGIESSKIYPCFEHETLTDLLDAANITWRYYTPNPNFLWTAPNAIQHLCGPNVPPPNATSCASSDWINNVILPTTENPAPILQDISNGQLASVSWVIPDGLASDHANMNDGSGPSWVASVVNAIGASSYWSNTAIIITWDDWGGWYDHVPPLQVIDDGVSWGSGYVYGFRVPLIVVSPYAKAGYVSHVTHDFGSILNVVEKVFGLPSLGYADARADDLSDCFDFTQTPLPFQTIAAPTSAEHFLNDRTPPTDPDDD